MSVISKKNYYMYHSGTKKWLKNDLSLGDKPEDTFTVVANKDMRIIGQDMVRIENNNKYIAEIDIKISGDGRCGQHESRKKQLLELTESCHTSDTNQVIGGVDFHHTSDRYLTPDESVGAECCALSLTNNCKTVDYISKGIIKGDGDKTVVNCPSGYVMVDMSWKHNHGEDTVDKESVGIRCCRPKGRINKPFESDEIIKSGEYTKISCPKDQKAMVGMSFRHVSGNHGTNQEFVQATCASVSVAKMVDIDAASFFNIKVTSPTKFQSICINTDINLTLVYNKEGDFFNVTKDYVDTWKLIPQNYYHCDEQCVKVDTTPDTKFVCETGDEDCNCWSGEESNKIFMDYRCLNSCGNPPSLPSVPCKTDTDCPLTGHKCVDGKCARPPKPTHKDCKKTADCPKGFICRLGKCEPIEYCFGNYDCAKGEICENNYCVNSSRKSKSLLLLIFGGICGSLVVILLAIFAIRFFRKRRSA